MSAQQNILDFTMEAAGLMKHLPYLIIHAICDHFDSRKNEE